MKLSETLSKITSHFYMLNSANKIKTIDGEYMVQISKERTAKITIETTESPINQDVFDFLSKLKREIINISLEGIKISQCLFDNVWIDVELFVYLDDI